jgi:hypothetical protein
MAIGDMARWVGFPFPIGDHPDHLTFDLYLVDPTGGLDNRNVDIHISRPSHCDGELYSIVRPISDVRVKHGDFLYSPSLLLVGLRRYNRLGLAGVAYPLVVGMLATVGAGAKSFPVLLCPPIIEPIIFDHIP